MGDLRFRWVGLFVVVLLAVSAPRAMAQRLPVGIILGKWCGETADYVFTRQKLAVFKHDGSTRELRIARFETGPDWISVYWQGMPKVNGIDANTLFEHFSPDRQTMNQARQDIGDKGPLRIFRRC
jgi:hypothetical protein